MQACFPAWNLYHNCPEVSIDRSSRLPGMGSAMSAATKAATAWTKPATGLNSREKGRGGTLVDVVTVKVVPLYRLWSQCP